MMRQAPFHRFVILAIILAGPAAAQTSRPTTQRSNGLALTDEQISERLEAMNRKASTQRSTPDNSDDVRARRERYIASQLAAADVEATIYRNAQAVMAQAAEALPKIGQEIGSLQREGRIAEAALNDILREFEALRAMAEQTGHSYFEGSYGGRVGDEVVSGGFRGSIDDPGERLRTIIAVESQYGPELRDARIRVSEIYAKYTPLVAKYNQLYARWGEANRAQAIAQVRYQKAMRNAGFAQAALGRTSTQGDDAIFAGFEKQYPGVDVRAVWDQSLSDAKRIVGESDPKLREIATGIMHAKCEAEVKRIASTQPATQPTK